jgi:hypothetical protein
MDAIASAAGGVVLFAWSGKCAVAVEIAVRAGADFNHIPVDSLVYCGADGLAGSREPQDAESNP